MNTKLHIVNSKEKSELVKEYFSAFNDDFNYLKDIELIFEPDNRYTKHEEDLNKISQGWFETAEIVDTRNLEGYEQDPVRLLLTDKFFGLPIKEKHETILHELGHYFTNPDLLEIRKYIAIKNPKLLNVNNAGLQPLVNAHNTALNFVFQIPKLLQEVNAELWVYKNERDYSKTRIRKYCSGIEKSIEEFKNATIQEDWFFEIPRLNFLILWRLGIIQSMDFDYIINCMEKTNEANGLFLKLAESVNWNQLEIFKLQSNILQSLKECNTEELILDFEKIFDDFVRNSSRFFPANMQRQLIEFYV